MTNFKNTSGFITLTVVLIIVLLITALSLMTGKMLMTEQRSASNQVRYHEAMNAAQAGLDKAIAQVQSADDFDDLIDFDSTSSPPYYHVEFGDITEITLGSNTVKSVTINAVGTSGYSADIEANAESQVTLNQKVVAFPTISGLPYAPLTVAAGMAIGGNFIVAANPNGGGPGVPLSIWSEEIITESDITGSFSSCGQQEYADNQCDDNPYSNKDNVGSDILSDDDGFPSNLLAYVFSGNQTIQDVIEDTIQMYPEADNYYVDRIGDGEINQPETVCDNLVKAGSAASGRYIIKGGCAINGVIGSLENPVQLLIWDGDLTLNANTVIWGLVFTYSDSATEYDVKLNGGAVLHGVFVSNFGLKISNGQFDAVYDANVLKNLVSQSNPIVATVPGSWRDW